MLVLVKANILAVGLAGRNKILESLPIRVCNIETGAQAGRSLKNENVDSVISNWNLVDSPNGKFIRNLKLAKPYLPVIAVVDAGDIQQEIAARSIGAAAVLSSDAADEIIRQTVIGVLGIDDTKELQKLCAIVDDLDHRHC
jgi:DNA-binding NarL/FixJ family response regulator